MHQMTKTRIQRTNKKVKRKIEPSQLLREGKAFSNYLLVRDIIMIYTPHQNRAVLKNKTAKHKTNQGNKQNTRVHFH